MSKKLQRLPIGIQDFEKMYRLGFPNKEVEEGFVKYLAPFYLSKQRKSF